jgi:sulfite exporter TauE/SafE
MNISLEFALTLGFLLGLKHATEADHLVAVTTIVSEQHSVLRSASVGVLWGIGHTAALLTTGAIVIFLNAKIPTGVADLIEFAVAVMIIFLGGRMLYLLLRGSQRFHSHAHRHSGLLHTHAHFHEREDAHRTTDPVNGNANFSTHHAVAAFSSLRPLLVGTVHGLAGSAALTLLVLTEVVATHSRVSGFGYLIVFGLGSICGMLLMSTLISLPLVLTARTFKSIERPAQITVAFLSIAFGIYYAYNLIKT